MTSSFNTEEDLNIVKGELRSKLIDAIEPKIPEYKKPIKLESAEGFEDLQLQFDSMGNRNIFGQSQQVEQRVEDYQGQGPGRIIIRRKTNTPEGIFFYPDNTEFNKRQMDRLNTAIFWFNAPSIFSPVVKAGQALRGKYFYMPPKAPLKTYWDNTSLNRNPVRPGLKQNLIKSIQGNNPFIQKTLNPIYTKAELGLSTSGPYPYASTNQGAIEPGDSVGGHLGYYNPNFPSTNIRDLDLYAKPPEDFMQVRNFEAALQAAEESLAEFKGKNWPGLDLKIGNEYVKVYRDSGGVKILPYNKWHQLKKDPFKVPPDIIQDLKLSEDIQLTTNGPPTAPVTVGSGRRVDKPITTRYPTGTVDKFVKHVNDQIAWQREVQRLDNEFGQAVLKTLRSKTDAELAELGIPPEIWKFDDPRKGPFSTDISHATARASGGPGYTFLEAWWSNQKRGSAPILQNHILQRMGIPTTWREYFERWYQEQGSGEPVTDLGKLADISIDDYFAVEKGEPLNKVKLRRKTINHLIQRQIENPGTFMLPGDIGETIGDDFEMLVRQSKGYDLNTDLSTIEHNLKEFDLRYRAESYGQLEEERAKFIKEQDLKRFKSKAEYSQKKEDKKKQKEVEKETKLKEKKGQQKLFPDD